MTRAALAGARAGDGGLSPSTQVVPAREQLKRPHCTGDVLVRSTVLLTPRALGTIVDGFYYIFVIEE